MKALLTLGLLLLSVSVQAKVYERCELARTLKSKGLDKYHGISLAKWVCLAQKRSNYNTEAKINYIHNRFREYGLFKLSSQYWCDDGKTLNSMDRCGIPCSALLQDDITQTIECVKKAVRDPETLREWFSWQTQCRNANVQQYIQNCGV